MFKLFITTATVIYTLVMASTPLQFYLCQLCLLPSTGWKNG